MKKDKLQDYINAINQWLDFGRDFQESTGKGAYFGSEYGWAHYTLVSLKNELEKEMEANEKVSMPGV